MFPRWGEHISLGICVSQIGGTHIPRVTCFPGREHISLGIRVSQAGEHISLGICVSKVGGHISLGSCVSQVGEHISLGDGPLEKLWGGGRGIFEPQDFFFCYQIPGMNFFSAIA